MLPVIPAVSAARGRPVILHCGLARTGTSTLQEHVFPALSGVAFLGLPAPTPALDWAIRHICQADTLYLEPERLAATFDAAISATAPSDSVVISYENFLLYKSKDKGVIAERLKALFPDASVLIVLRRQESMIVSRYLTNMRKNIKRRALLPFDEWWEVERREAYRSVFDDLRYGPMVDYYATLFGRERVQELLFEELQADPATYAARLARFLGADLGQLRSALEGHRENAAMSASRYRFWRLFGHLLPRRLARELAIHLPAGRGGRVSLTLSPAMLAEVRTLCAGDNARLAREYGLDLSRYGYLLPHGEPTIDGASESSQPVPPPTDPSYVPVV
jgi:hypothetical protein